REIVDRQLDDAPVIATKIVHLLEIRRAEDAETQVPEAVSDLQRAVATDERLVQLAEQRVQVRDRRTDSAPLAVVVEPLGQYLGRAQAFQRLSDFTELVQHDPLVQADLETLGQRRRTLRHPGERVERLLEPAPGVRQGRPRGRLDPGLPQIEGRPLPQLAPDGMLSEPLDLAGRVILVEPLDRLDDPAVKRTSTLAQEPAIRDLVHESVLEGILEIGIQAGLVEEFGRLQGLQAAPELVLRKVGDRFQKRERNVAAADDRRQLQKTLVLGREPVDARRQQRVLGGGNLDRVDLSGQPIGARLSDQRLRLHQGPNGLLQESRITTPDEQLLERDQPGIVSEQRIEQLLGALRRQPVQSNLTVEGLAAPGMLVFRPVAHDQQE